LQARVRLSSIIVAAVGLHQVLALVVLAVVFAALVHLGLSVPTLLLLFNAGRMLLLARHFVNFVFIIDVQVRVFTLVVYWVWVKELFGGLRHHRHVINELIWHFAKHLQRQLPHTQVFEVSVLDQLHDISNSFSTYIVGQDTRIGIKHLHIFEIAVTNTDDNA